MAKRGRFIVIEGLEGAGKSTALATIKNILEPHVPGLITTREPGGTLLGEAIRDLIKADSSHEHLDSRSELLLFYAARVQLIESIIKPALARGDWVLADRFELSTFAYQGGGREIDYGFIHHLSEYCLGDFKPDLTLFLDIKPELGLHRALLRGKADRIEQESIDFFHRVYDAYHRRLLETQSVCMIDASMPLDDVQAAIRTALSLFIESHG